MGNTKTKIIIEHFLSFIGANKTRWPESRAIESILRNRADEGEMGV